MKKLEYFFSLSGEFIMFARKKKIYWLIPLMLLMIPAGIFIVGSEVAAPLIYTLF